MSALSSPPAALRRQSSYDLDGPDLLELCMSIPHEVTSVPSSLDSSSTSDKTGATAPPPPDSDEPGAANGEGISTGPDAASTEMQHDTTAASPTGSHQVGHSAAKSTNPPPFVRGWDAVLSRAKSLDDRSLRAELFKADGSGMSVLMFCLCFNGPVELVEVRVVGEEKRGGAKHSRRTALRL